MQLSDISSATEKDLRVFAGLQMIFLGVVEYLLFKEGVAPLWIGLLLVTSLAVGVVGLWQPKRIRPVYIVWMAAVFPIGWAVSHLLMALVYYVVVTPIGIWKVRSSGDPMQREFDSQKESYWEDTPTEKSQKSYFRQF